MPAARARTCATREASSRPGSSVTRPDAAGVRDHHADLGRRMAAAAAAAFGASPLPQAVSASSMTVAAAMVAGRGENNEWRETCKSGM